MAEHGTNACYLAGCHQDCCRVAHNAAVRAWKLKNYGLRLVPAQVTARQIRALGRKGWSRRKLAAEVGCHYNNLQLIATGRATHTNPRLARAVQSVWEDVCAPLERDRRLWPIEPFKEAVVARYGSLRALGNTNQARNIYRGADLSTQTAENYAESLGMHPTEIWGPAWYQE